MHIRKEIRSLTMNELLALRRAMLELQRRNGIGSYIDLAGYHGIPRRLCPHGSPMFLPWHRVYIRMFEQALQAIDSTVTLPFWDWTSSESLSQGMAAAHSDVDFDDDGNIRPNPLASGPIEDRSRQTFRVPPHDPNSLRSFASSVNLAMRQNNYIDFNDDIQGPHGSIHVWVGGPNGDMSTVPRAAYDPIFWSHHSNVDRQWAIWQKCNPEQNPPSNLMTQQLSGFPTWTVADTIDITSPRFDYTYDGLETASCPSAPRTEPEGRIPFMFPESTLLEPKPRVVVEVQDIASDGESFMVDIFVHNKSSSNGESNVYGGSFGIFGAEGLHSTHHEHHHELKTIQRIDITDAIDKLGLNSNQLEQSIELQLLATNKFGDSINPNGLPIGKLELKVFL